MLLRLPPLLHDRLRQLRTGRRFTLRHPQSGIDAHQNRLRRVTGPYAYDGQGQLRVHGEPGDRPRPTSLQAERSGGAAPARPPSPVSGTVARGAGATSHAAGQTTAAPSTPSARPRPLPRTGARRSPPNQEAAPGPPAERTAASRWRATRRTSGAAPCASRPTSVGAALSTGGRLPSPAGPTRGSRARVPKKRAARSSAAPPPSRPGLRHPGHQVRRQHAASYRRTRTRTGVTPMPRRAVGRSTAWRQRARAGPGVSVAMRPGRPKERRSGRLGSHRPRSSRSGRVSRRGTR